MPIITSAKRSYNENYAETMIISSKFMALKDDFITLINLPLHWARNVESLRFWKTEVGIWTPWSVLDRCSLCCQCVLLCLEG